MKHEGNGRRTRTDNEGPKRRPRPKVVAEDYDEDDFSDSYDVIEPEAQGARLPDEDKLPPAQSDSR